MTITECLFKINTGYESYNVTRGGFLTREVTPRLSHMAKIPLSLVTTITDTAIGVLLSLGSILTLGRFGGLNGTAWRYLSESSRIIPLASMHLIKTVNPSATCKMRSEGLLRFHFREFVPYQYRENFFQRQMTRVFEASLAAAARIVDGVFGAIALPIALVTFGKYESINSFAINHLSVGGIVVDVLFPDRIR